MLKSTISMPDVPPFICNVLIDTLLTSWKVKDDVYVMWLFNNCTVIRLSSYSETSNGLDNFNCLIVLFNNIGYVLIPASPDAFDKLSCLLESNASTSVFK